jgi:hypothetical protein
MSPLAHLEDEEIQANATDTLDPAWDKAHAEPSARRSTGDTVLDDLLARLDALEDPHNPARDRALIRIARRAVEKREEALAVEAERLREDRARKASKRRIAHDEAAAIAVAQLEPHAPRIEIVYGGKIVTLKFDANSDPATMLEATRRLVFRLGQSWQSRVAGTRQSGAALPASMQWLNSELNSEAGVLHIARRGLLSVKGDSQ